MNIHTSFLSNQEKQIFINVLFYYKDAIAFDDFEMKLLDSVIKLLVIIHTIFYISWQ